MNVDATVQTLGYLDLPIEKNLDLIEEITALKKSKNAV